MTQMMQVKGVKTSTRRDAQGLHVRYHDTDVVTAHTDGRITLRTGGWKTATTKTRMNQAANEFGLEYSVWQKAGQWFVTVGAATLAFDADSITFRPVVR